MLCPKCSSKTEVTESRTRKGNLIRRKRLCTNEKCRFGFNTIEFEYAIPEKRRLSKENIRKILEEKELVIYLITFLENYLKLKEHSDMVEFQTKKM